MGYVWVYYNPRGLVNNELNRLIELIYLILGLSRQKDSASATTIIDRSASHYF